MGEGKEERKGEGEREERKGRERLGDRETGREMGLAWAFETSKSTRSDPSPSTRHTS